MIELFFNYVLDDQEQKDALRYTKAIEWLGGERYAEVKVYDKTLTAQQLSMVKVHLIDKWDSTDIIVLNTMWGTRIMIFPKK